MKRTKSTKRLTIRLPRGLADRLTARALQLEMYESEYVRDILRRELLVRDILRGGLLVRGGDVPTEASSAGQGQDDDDLHFLFDESREVLDKSSR